MFAFELCHKAKHKNFKLNKLKFVVNKLQAKHWKAFNVKEMKEARAATENVKQENI